MALASGLTLSAGGAPLPGQQADSDTVTVFVASRTLPRGIALQESDMVRDVRVIRRGAPRAPAHVGWVTRRVVRAGEVLAGPAVVPPPAIVPGQPVQFVLERGGVTISVPGTAAVTASIGDTVVVRLGALRRATGIVTGPTTVMALSQERDR